MPQHDIEMLMFRSCLHVVEWRIIILTQDCFHHFEQVVTPHYGISSTDAKTWAR
ncbi:hypothetical protein E8E14_012913 [Neopestalotiopsis sp. 37M]|nr:hypothetical protein E8E14_012913 [Neopestalotiopsis sp. 37M]